MVYFLKFGASWVLPPGIFILALFALAVWLWSAVLDSWRLLALAIVGQ